MDTEHVIPQWGGVRLRKQCQPIQVAGGPHLNVAGPFAPCCVVNWLGSFNWRGISVLRVNLLFLMSMGDPITLVV